MVGKFLIDGVSIFLGVSIFASGATLKPETKAAWDEYLQNANAAMQARLRPDAHFLWLEDQPAERAVAIRSKGPDIAPAGDHFRKKCRRG